MDVIVERCAGLDVGKDEVVACVRRPGPSGKGRQAELRVFATFTSSLEELADWLADNGVAEALCNRLLLTLALWSLSHRCQTATGTRPGK
ncbi:MAG: hypothetical protein ACYDAD_10410 [Acidimicrobiales bacterium]